MESMKRIREKEVIFLAELRYNPLLDDWTMVSADRSKRPDMPKDWCPFCPGSGKVPDHYDVLKYDNDFPILRQDPPTPDPVGSSFYKTAPAYGKCEVILYSPDHYGKLWKLPLSHIKKLVDLWQQRYEELSADPKVNYVLIFENKGAEVGTTMPHPHGQIYAYGFMPLRIRLESGHAKKYFTEHGNCIYCKINQEEQDFEKRLIMENEHFIAYIPFFTDYPYGVYISAKEHFSSFKDMNENMKTSFAEILRNMTGTFDTLFDKPFPYMMAIYQEPLHDKEHPHPKDYSHFHVKFFPPLRGENSIKWNASSETAAWAKANPKTVESCAEELQEAYKIFQKMLKSEVKP